MKRLSHAAGALLCACLSLCPETVQGRELPRAPDLEALWSLTDLASNFAISPNGEEIAIIERRMDVGANVWRHHLVLVDLAGGHRRVIADAGDVILRTTNGRRSGAPIERVARYSRNGDWIYFLASIDGAIELRRVAARGDGARRVAAFAGDVRSFSVADNGALVVEVATPHRLLADDRHRERTLGFLADEDFSPGYALEPLERDQRERSVLIVDGLTGEVLRRATPDALLGGNEAPSRVRLAPLDASGQGHRPPLRIYLRSASGEAHCADAACEGALADAWLRGSRTGDSVIFQNRTGHALASETIGEWRPGADVRIIRRSTDRLAGCQLREPMLICVQDDALTPKRLVAIDLATGALRILYDPNPAWSGLSLPRVERLEFTDPDGNESFADLVYPTRYRRSRRSPLVVVQYRSRGFLAGGVGGETPIYALSSRGYAVLSVDRPEFRNREAEMPLAQLQREIELSGAERGAKRAALDYFLSTLIDRGVVDERRIGITGLSDGAETLYAMLVDEPSRFAAAVAGTPPTDAAGWWLNAPSYRAQSFARLGLTAPWETAPSPWTAWWEANGAALHASDIRTPLLLNLGESEALRAFPLVTRLRDAGRPVEAFVYPGSYHVKSTPSHIVAAQIRTLAWLDYWLRDTAPPDRPETLGAQDRWDRMRAGLVQPDAMSSALGGDTVSAD